jgi:hypothetical protein
MLAKDDRADSTKALTAVRNYGRRTRKYIIVALCALAVSFGVLGVVIALLVGQANQLHAEVAANAGQTANCETLNAIRTRAAGLWERYVADFQSDSPFDKTFLAQVHTTYVLTVCK